MLTHLLTFFKTENLIINDRILMWYSDVYFSRNSEYGVVSTPHSSSENDGDDKLYLFDISKKSLNPISTGIPIISDHVYFSPNGDKVLYGYGRQGKSTKFTKGADSEGAGLKIFNIANGENDEIVSSLGEYSFEIASKYYNWFSKEKPYIYGWIDENKIGFSCTKESENMKAQLDTDQDKENNFLYCVYDNSTGKIEIVKNAPKLFDGNLPSFSSSDIVNYNHSPAPIPNSSNKIESKRILHGFDGSTAVEIHIIDINWNKKIIYRGHGFDKGYIYVTSNGDLLIKNDYNLLKIN